MNTQTTPPAAGGNATGAAGEVAPATECQLPALGSVEHVFLATYPVVTGARLVAALLIGVTGGALDPDGVYRREGHLLYMDKHDNTPTILRNVAHATQFISQIEGHFWLWPYEARTKYPFTHTRDINARTPEQIMNKNRPAIEKGLTPASGMPRRQPRRKEVKS